MYRLILSNDIIELDNDLDVNERIKLCEQILAAYPEEFVYTIPTSRPKAIELDYSEKVKSRLRTLGEYIYQASPNPERQTVITRYREKVDRVREVKMEIKD